jgi:sugar transferase (PEP-CTERM/EpsH1 system associated)
MANLLYLVHRMPYPPNKGDKVRSYHLLKHLAARHRVFLGTFVDDPDDMQHLPALRDLCAEVCAVPLNPATARLGSLLALAQGLPLTLRYYDHAAMHAWVRQLLARQPMDATLVFSSSMAQYAQPSAQASAQAIAQPAAPQSPAAPILLDLVDVDSAKWTEYAARHAWPLSWLYRREGLRLLAYERAAVKQAALAFLVTDKEVALFNRLAPDCQGRVEAIGNGVDADYFAPAGHTTSPYGAGELPVVFTGAMDYWPNVDAVTWFAQAMLPALRQRWPALRFHIVGRNPTPAVRALASDAVVVSGTVPDVRPFLAHAAVVVAPLRLARGVQNKVLEAMAMARPVVCAGPCAEAIDAEMERHLLAAETAQDYVLQINRLLADADLASTLGRAGRQFVLDHFSWDARLSPIDNLLSRLGIGSPSTTNYASA